MTDLDLVEALLAILTEVGGYTTPEQQDVLAEARWRVAHAGPSDGVPR